MVLKISHIVSQHEVTAPTTLLMLLIGSAAVAAPEQVPSAASCCAASDKGRPHSDFVGSPGGNQVCSSMYNAT